MQKISKEDINYLVNKKVLKQSRGNYGEQLVVTNKQSGKNKKQRYVTDPLYYTLLKLRLVEKLEIMGMSERLVLVENLVKVNILKRNFDDPDNLKKMSMSTILDKFVRLEPVEQLEALRQLEQLRNKDMSAL